ncbi:ADP-ribosyltransferase [Lentilactobacillus farraginis]|uniref:VIP2 family actin-ADP-ribosylating toxin n=1 Tax=Lentilactobacillus farraginis DSM 18382 = JCM 14108 TaxID=1423743 RepID=A0A0R1VP87_9LACO|nr:ADP-ribosyltransferase [Lentilactobacillus farraginis]KRM07394.1 VIP2 family actin-ADP-ribosylating toxin [Lentilactobacillus farraginis DSM 18382 = JCM 14108]
MKRIKKLLFAAALILGLSVQGTALAKTVHHQTSIQNNFLMIQSDTVTTNVGKSVFVTNQPTTAYEWGNQRADYQNPVQIPKNTALTVQQKLPGAKYLVTVPGNPTEMLVEKPSQFSYSYKRVRNNAHEIDKLTQSSLKWAKKLNQKQYRAIRYYTGNGYDVINQALRKSQKKMIKTTRSKISAINNGIHKFKLNAPLTVFRGTSLVGLKKSLADQAIQVGGEYRDPAYSSTTLDRMTALAFSQHVILRINIPKGYHGAYVDPISENRGEKEYLMQAGTKMIITRLQKGYTSLHETSIEQQSGKKAHVKHLTRHLKYWIVTLDLMK